MGIRVGASASYLYRRGSGIYAVRIFVPRCLWSSLGKRELHVSTRSRDQAVAKVVGLSIVLVWKQRFVHLMGIDVDKLVKGSPLLAGTGHLPLVTAATELGMDPQTLLREMVNHRIPLLCWATGWHDVQCFDDVELNADGQRVLNDAPNVGESTNAFPLIAVDDAESVAEELIRNGTACSTCRMGRETMVCADDHQDRLSLRKTPVRDVGNGVAASDTCGLVLRE